jgi:hypothetical protein
MAGDASTTMIYMLPREAVRRLASAGVVRGLDDASLDALRDECWDGSEESLEEAGLLGILSFYYETPERGAQDGFVWHASEFWHDTDDAASELSACLHDAKPMFKTVSAKARGPVLAMVIERDDGVRQELEARSLADLVDLFNAELTTRKHAKRFVRLDTGGGDWEMYVAIEPKLAIKLSAEGALPVLDLDSTGD